MLDQMKVKEQFLNDKVMTVLFKKILHLRILNCQYFHPSNRIIVTFQFVLYK